MNMRAMWKGSLSLGKNRLPLKLYAAVEDAAIHFHLLHADDEVRVEQRIVNPSSGEVVPKPEIRHGFALGGSRFVLVSDEELERLKPKPSRTIEVIASLAIDAIPPAYFARPYFLGPDGDANVYAALVEALAARKRQCLVRFAMRNTLYYAALRSDGAALSLVTLRSRDEVLAAPALDTAPQREPSKQELALAEQLVTTLEAEFDPSLLRSRYREEVREFVKRKAEGKPIKLHKLPERKAATTSLTSALKASLARTRPARKAQRKELKSA